MCFVLQFYADPIAAKNLSQVATAVSSHRIQPHSVWSTSVIYTYGKLGYFFFVPVLFSSDLLLVGRHGFWILTIKCNNTTATTTIWWETLLFKEDDLDLLVRYRGQHLNISRYVRKLGIQHRLKDKKGINHQESEKLRQ